MTEKKSKPPEQGGQVQAKTVGVGVSKTDKPSVANPPPKRTTMADLKTAIEGLSEEDRAALLTPQPSGGIDTALKEAVALGAVDSAEELLRMAATLPVDEREKLARMGAIVPQGIAGQGDADKSVYGYRCHNCDNIALRFLGTRWGPQGESAVPIAGTPLRHMAWTQDNIQPNREDPRCQWCGATVRLTQAGGLTGPSGAYPHGQIVNLEEHAAMNDPVRLAREAEERRRARQGIPTSLHGTSHNFEGAEPRISTILDAQDAQGRPQPVEGEAPVNWPRGATQPPGTTRQTIERVAELTGLNDPTMGGLFPGNG